ncbi:metal ABC transporter substrate-binding protein [Fonticella tunisiensis]|uniref:Zinc transport system substrate-binding protein n=1 Tax=Fonticella tunisiensis TaxID=1096341 RepID=A0A4R7KMD2_9CLOT|nr:metal ABC transporter substrate-binding protein [Fonticella tunisiensis]TDT57264.1 zinc transport system substrate-binding protein [Fonticella tunisiensis]
MHRKFAAIIVAMIMIGVLSSCSSNSNSGSTDTSGKIKVMVSINPLKEFVEAIGKDKVEVQMIVPEGMEPHDFEPRAKDIEAIGNAKVFVYNGLGMENWVDRVLGSIDNRKLIVVDSSKGVSLIKASGDEDHDAFDPHIWLSLKEAKVQAGNIKDALIKADGANRDFYESNYNAFASQLDSLYNEYREKFDKVTNKKFVTGHAAFAYLCRDFGLEQNSVENVFAEGEPSAKKLKELVEYAKNNNVKTIFSESMASPKVSETLAREIGAKVEKIYTIESREDGKDYLESMRYNLEKIYNSLK